MRFMLCFHKWDNKKLGKIGSRRRKFLNHEIKRNGKSKEMVIKRE